jgi:methyl-accepting chemotaxis protein
MANIFKGARIRDRLILLVGVSVIGFIIFGSLSYSTLNTLKVNGSLYRRIVQGKDLIADILPPPQYIIESYLVALQMIDEKDPARLDTLLRKTRVLKDDPVGGYDVRHEHWVKDLPENTAKEKELKEFMIKDSYEPAIKFYEILNNEFSPLILKGEREKARELAFGALRDKYEEHRAAIDKVVVGATERNTQDEAQARQTIVFMTVLLVVIGLGIIILICILCIMLVRQTTIPLLQVVTTAEKISSGDLTVEKLTLKSKDEIGRLAEVFNQLLDSLQNIFGRVRSTAEKVAASAEELSSSSEEVNASTQEVSSAIQNVSKGAATQAERVTQTSELMEKSSVTLQQAMANAQATSSAVSQTSSRAQHGKLAAQEAVDKITRLTNTVVETAKVIQGLGEKSQAIGEITETITSIADQTNLLALNAAIEAARAGEAGRGFAVVAEEVRKLAEGSAEAVRKIGNLIRSIQSETQEAVGAISASSKEAGEGRAEVTKIADVLDDINKAVQEVNTLTTQISSSIQQQVKDNDVVTRAFTDVATIAKESAATAQEVSSSTQEQAASMQEMSASAQELSNLSVTLKGLIGKFKVAQG